MMLRQVIVSTAALLSLASYSLADLPRETEFPHRTEVVEGSLRFVLGMTTGVLFDETPIDFYLGVENIGGTEVSIPNPGLITPMFLWQVRRVGCEIGDPKPECTAVFVCPDAVFFFGTPLTLSPGGFKEYTCSWGEPQYGIDPEPGEYWVKAGFQSGLGMYHAPQGGVRLKIAILNGSVATEHYTWGRIKVLLAGSN